MGAVANARNALATTLAAGFSGANVSGFERKSPARPAIIVSWPDEYDPRPDFGTSVDFTIPVRVEVDWADDEQSDTDIETFMEAIVAVIEADPTLSGAVNSLTCRAFTNIGAFRKPDDSMTLQFVVPVDIFA